MWLVLCFVSSSVSHWHIDGTEYSVHTAGGENPEGIRFDAEAGSPFIAEKLLTEGAKIAIVLNSVEDTSADDSDIPAEPSSEEEQAEEATEVEESVSSNEVPPAEEEESVSGNDGPPDEGEEETSGTT